jgi:hypothetical protein
MNYDVRMRSLNAFLICFVFLWAFPPLSAAQKPAPVLEFSAGPIGFTDATETFVSGAARFYVLPRVSVGPELTYINGDGHSHVVVTGNFVFDFLRSEITRPRRVTPFAVVGGGLFQTREQFSFSNFNSTEGAFTAGGGFRTALGSRLTVGAEVRVGWETHVRAGVLIGVKLGK